MEKLKMPVPKDWIEYYNELLKLSVEKRSEISEISIQKSHRNILANETENGKVRYTLLRDQHGREYAVKEEHGTGYRVHGFSYNFTREKHKSGYEYLQMQEGK